MPENLELMFDVVYRILIDFIYPQKTSKKNEDFEDFFSFLSALLF